MKNRKCLSTLLSMVFALACFHVSVSGQSSEDKNRIASIAASGANVRWELAVPYSALTITVSAPNGKVYRREFKGGDAPSFALFDKHGNRLPDGTYTYELRLSPVLSSATKKELAAARQKDDDAMEEAEGRARTQLPTHPLVESGSFSVQRGAIIVAGGVEPDAVRPSGKVGMRPRAGRPYVQSEPFSIQEATFIVEAAALRSNGRTTTSQPFAHAALPDQVIPDDLIVEGSLCVGFDCVNNENFGFDTIRLKENNTRLKFDDTSTTAGYPANDWQLTANDSASGGSSKFSIEDITGAKVPFTIEAGATTNSIYVSSIGRLGLRTSTPVLDVHANTSNTPAIRLEQNNSGGFTAQTWDIGSNEANFFIRDVTGGSKLSFRIRPGAPTSSIDIAASGNVGIGTAGPNSKLDLKQSEDTFIGGLHLRRATTNDTWALATGTDSNLYMAYANSASLANAASDFTVIPMVITTSNRVGIATTAPDQTLSVNGDASKVGGGSWQVFSDERLKNIKGRFTSGLSAVMQLHPLRYEYRRDNALGLRSGGEHVGFGAKELQAIIPEAVTRNEQGYLLVNNDPILWTMLNAIKEQQKQIEQLKTEVQRLRRAAGRRRR